MEVRKGRTVWVVLFSSGIIFLKATDSQTMFKKVELYPHLPILFLHICVKMLKKMRKVFALVDGQNLKNFPNLKALIHSIHNNI